jgi:hypothetical protein
MPAKHLFDTNIYIQCMLDRDFALQHAEQYSRHLPSTFFSSVVAQELIVGCTNDLAVRLVQNFFGLLSVSGGLSTPPMRTGKKPVSQLSELRCAALT